MMAHAGGHRLRLNDRDALIPGLTDDVALNCLARVGIPDDFGSLSCLNTRFNELIKSGYLFELRKQLGILDHWLYLNFYHIVCKMSIPVMIPHWKAFDPVTKMWLRLPELPSDLDFRCLENTSIVVGSELLVFKREKSTLVIWKYNIVHQNWVKCSGINYPYDFQRFALSSYGSIAIVAGGVDRFDTILNTVEMYDSATGKWEVLPNMHTSRRSCSGFFIDGKFYVLGGVADLGGTVPLTCGEEFDLKTRKWRKIEGMCKNINLGARTHRSPLVAVVDNELYAVEYLTMMVKKYDKKKNDWDALGRLPFEADSPFCSAFSFKAVGDKLMVLAACAGSEGERLVLSAWSPSSGVDNGRLKWKVLGVKKLGELLWGADSKFKYLKCYVAQLL